MNVGEEKIVLENVQMVIETSQEGGETRKRIEFEYDGKPYGLMVVLKNPTRRNLETMRHNLIYGARKALRKLRSTK